MAKVGFEPTLSLRSCLCAFAEWMLPVGMEGIEPVNLRLIRPASRPLDYMPKLSVLTHTEEDLSRLCPHP